MTEKEATVRTLQKLDAFAINKIGVPSCVLMENAGRYVSLEVQKEIKKSRKRHVTVVCGIGNNAGDGFVVARHLLIHRIPIKVFFLGKPSRLKQDTFINYTILQRLKCPIKPLSKVTPSFCRTLRQTDIIVDAIFGIGLNRPVEGLFYQAIDVINKARKRVISVDVPSGLGADTGKIFGICIKASKTVTFMLPKKGFSKGEGPKYSGRVVCVDIGVPASLLRRI